MVNKLIQVGTAFVGGVLVIGGITYLGTENETTGFVCIVLGALALAFSISYFELTKDKDNK